MLRRNDAIGCIDHAYTLLRQHVNQEGDSPIPQNLAGLEFRFRTIEFSITTSMPPPLPPESALSYKDALAILNALVLEWVSLVVRRNSLYCRGWIYWGCPHLGIPSSVIQICTRKPLKLEICPFGSWPMLFVLALRLLRVSSTRRME